MVLHFMDAATARGIAGAITGALAPGSYVVISAGSGDEQTGGMLAREYQAGPLYNHSPAQIGAFFEGLDLIPPGLTDAWAWEPGRPRRCGLACAAGTSWPASAASRPPASPVAYPSGAPWPAGLVTGTTPEPQHVLLIFRCRFPLSRTRQLSGGPTLGETR